MKAAGQTLTEAPGVVTDRASADTSRREGNTIGSMTIVDLHTHAHFPSFYSRSRLPWRYRATRRLASFVRQTGCQPDAMGVGRINAMVTAIYPPEIRLWSERTFREHALAELAAVRDLVEECRDRLLLAASPRDLQPVDTGGRVALIPALEGGHCLGGEVAALDDFHSLGVRVFQPAHWIDNRCVRAERSWRGRGRPLEPFGREAVRRAIRLGMVVDVAHMASRALGEVLDLAPGRVIDSHACVRELCPVSRNRTLGEIRGLAASGGMIGINFFPPYLKRKARKAPVSRVAEHIDAAVEAAGPEQVGIGSDRWGIPFMADGLDGPSGLQLLARQLDRRGYPPEAVRGILGENFLRFWTEVVARKRGGTYAERL